MKQRPPKPWPNTRFSDGGITGGSDYFCLNEEYRLTSERKPTSSHTDILKDKLKEIERQETEAENKYKRMSELIGITDADIICYEAFDKQFDRLREIRARRKVISLMINQRERKSNGEDC